MVALPTAWEAACAGGNNRRGRGRRKGGKGGRGGGVVARKVMSRGLDPTYRVVQKPKNRRDMRQQRQHSIVNFFNILKT
jgi:hypothetical protein